MNYIPKRIAWNLWATHPEYAEWLKNVKVGDEAVMLMYGSRYRTWIAKPSDPNYIVVTSGYVQHLRSTGITQAVINARVSQIFPAEWIWGTQCLELLESLS